MIASRINIRVGSENVIVDVLFDRQFEKLPPDALRKPIQRSGEYLLQGLWEIMVSFFGI